MMCLLEDDDCLEAARSPGASRDQTVGNSASVFVHSRSDRH